MPLISIGYRGHHKIDYGIIRMLFDMQRKKKVVRLKSGPLYIQRTSRVYGFLVII
jgi:hypothetical protein